MIRGFFPTLFCRIDKLNANRGQAKTNVAETAICQLGAAANIVPSRTPDLVFSLVSVRFAPLVAVFFGSVEVSMSASGEKMSRVTALPPTSLRSNWRRGSFEESRKSFNLTIASRRSSSFSWWSVCQSRIARVRCTSRTWKRLGSADGIPHPAYPLFLSF